MSFVAGAENVSFLEKRFEAMSAHHCYHGMEYTEDTEDRRVGAAGHGRANARRAGAATRIVTGTDVDYGALTHHLVDHLVQRPASRCITATASPA